MASKLERRNGHAGNGKVAPPAPPLPPVCDGAGTAPAAEGRDLATGRFGAGNKFGTGNPFNRRVGRLRAAFVNAITDDDMVKLARKWRDLALTGDLAAGQLLMQFVIGKPAEAPNPDTLDAEEWRQLRELPDESQVLNARKRLDPALAATVARGASLLPALALLRSPQLCGPTTGPRVRAALIEGGFADVVEELDALEARVAENGRRMEEQLGSEAVGGFEARARRAYVEKQTLSDE
jgi:hypothetical protein